MIIKSFELEKVSSLKYNIHLIYGNNEGIKQDIIKNYYLKNASLRVELNKEDFIKRIVLLSDKVNLSVYINDCEFSTIENIYFSYSPFFKYKY